MKVNYNEYIDVRLNTEIKKAKKANKKIKSFVLTPNEYEELQKRPIFLGVSYLPENITKYNGIDIVVEINSQEDN